MHRKHLEIKGLLRILSGCAVPVRPGICLVGCLRDIRLHDTV